MKTINGIYTSADIYTVSDESIAIDDYAISQLQMLCDNITADATRIRIMPDVHPGKVGTIGLTMTVGTRLMPNLIGVDIGCGMTLAHIKTKKTEFQQLDKVIRDCIPSGFAIRTKAHHMADECDLSALRCHKHIRHDKASLSLGTLGGGNHFIEVDKDDNNNLYIVIHSGSRHLGYEVTDYYLSKGSRTLQEHNISVPYELTYLEGQLLDDYIYDTKIITEYAALNRKIILHEITKNMKWKIINQYDSIHNYIDTRDATTSLFNAPILRKGAISALADEPVIIPINMRDGIILGTGLGNINYNCSAPHGAGRIIKRECVSSQFTLSQYKAATKGIYSSCISKSTLDEAPFAYRRLDAIRDAIKDTVNINNIIKPLYNFKAGGN